MNFEILEIDENKLYNFVIGTRSKPDSQLKARIRAQIREAMESLGRSEDSYSVSIVRNEEETPKEKEPEPMRPGSNYLIFAILYSGDSAELPSDKELEEEKEELARGIMVPHSSRVALVLLYDQMIRTLVTEKPGRVFLGDPLYV
jgi:hypothetical protein